MTPNNENDAAHASTPEPDPGSHSEPKAPPSPSGLPEPNCGTPADLTVSLDLVRRAKEGQTEALNRLFERYYPRVRAITRVRLGRHLRTCMDSGDILQETFSAAVRSFDNFEMRDEASLINWLAKLAEHQITAAADYHNAKKRDRRREVSLPSSPSQSHFDPKLQFADRSPQPHEDIGKREQTEVVEECLSKLPDEYRELVLLRHYAGMSWSQVAEQTGRPSPQAARMMYSRAVTELTKLARERGVQQG